MLWLILTLAIFYPSVRRWYFFICGRTGGNVDSVALAEFLRVFAVSDESCNFVLCFRAVNCECEAVLSSYPK